MSKVSKFVPLATIIGGFIIVFVSGYDVNFKPDTGLVSALIYAGLGSSAAVGFSKYWRKN